MTRTELRTRDETRLNGVHPTLAEKVLTMLAALDVLGFPMTVTDGARTTAQQVALYRQGRQQQADGTWVKVGDTVTNADGIVKRSNHQIHADGFGHAVDLAFLDERLQPTWTDDRPWALYGAIAKALGLVWGGSWSSIVDRPHVELPA